MILRDICTSGPQQDLCIPPLKEERFTASLKEERFVLFPQYNLVDPGMLAKASKQANHAPV